MLREFWTAAYVCSRGVVTSRNLATFMIKQWDKIDLYWNFSPNMFVQMDASTQLEQDYDQSLSGYRGCDIS
jgi:hypothetical protein